MKTIYEILFFLAIIGGLVAACEAGKSEGSNPTMYEEKLTCYFGDQKITETIRSEDGTSIWIADYGTVVYDENDNMIYEFSPGVPCNRTRRIIGNEEDNRDTSS